MTIQNPKLRPGRAFRVWLPVLIMPLLASLASAAEETWAIDVTPYLWVAGVTAETSLPDSPPSTPSEATRFDTRIAAGAMLSAEVHYRSVGVWFDIAWLRLDSSATTPLPAFAAVDLKSDFIHSTAAFSYRVPMSGKFQLEVLAGARLWYISETIAASGNVLPGFNASGKNVWVDPIVGADLRYNLTQRWSLLAKGTVGGFGAAAELGWEAMGGVSYRCSDWCTVALGYRYLHEDYARKQFTFNTDIQGFILGVGLHF